MIESRPEFEKILSFDEFNKYYWYRDELSQICNSLGLEYRGTKQELNDIIEQYFKGNLIKKSSIKNKKKRVEVITLDTPLLECGFSFNAHFREYFSTLTDRCIQTAGRFLNMEGPGNPGEKEALSAWRWCPLFPPPDRRR